MKPVLLVWLPALASACSAPHAYTPDSVQVIDSTPKIGVTDLAPDSTVLPAVTTDELTGRFNPAAHPDFVLISGLHTDKQNIYMRKEAYEQFSAMHKAAQSDGIELRIISATRNFNYQKRIWEDKWKQPRYMGWQELDKARDIMTYSSMPSTSRHHWGTDVDLNSLDNSWFSKGEGKKLYEWLNTHAHEYGFYQTYTSKNTGRTGYEEEKWHWSYMPLSAYFLEQYNLRLTIDSINGFAGARAAQSLEAISNYVNGIDSSLKKPATHFNLKK